MSTATDLKGNALRTPTELAEILRIETKDPHDTVLAMVRKHKWPHRRLDRYRIRFTDEDVAAIVRRSYKASPKTTDTPGLTGRSAARQRTKRGP